MSRKCECGGFIVKELNSFKTKEWLGGTMDISLTYPTVEPTVRYYCLSCNKDHTETIEKQNYKLLKEFGEKLLKEIENEEM